MSSPSMRLRNPHGRRSCPKVSELLAHILCTSSLAATMTQGVRSWNVGKLDRTHVREAEGSIVLTAF